MKHLLIILSILLLSTPVMGDNHKGETLYRWDNPSGDGYVWKGFGDKETHPVYKGDVKNGKPNGLGVITYSDEDKYIGEFKNGERHGQGTYTFKSGRQIKGEWKDNQPNGQGTDTFPDGEKYVGEFKNGKRHGRGTSTYPFGRIRKWIGEWKDGEIFGNGKMFLEYGRIFEGQVFGNVGQYGKGIETLKDGKKYVGVWYRNPNNKIWKWEITGYDKNGEVILEISKGKGKGLYVFNDGFNYLGEFKNGKRHGNGTQTLGKLKYVGGWKDGKYHGKGILNGWRDSYEGEFKNGEYHGLGTLTNIENLKKYIGDWKDGKKHGKGKDLLPDGKKYYEGGWKNGKYDGIGKLYNRDNGELEYDGEFKNGEYHGQGTDTGCCGVKYEGEWKDGRKHGQGKITFSNSKGYWLGVWKNGNEWNVTGYDENRNIEYNWVNGVKQTVKKQSKTTNLSFLFPEMKNGKPWNGTGTITYLYGEYVGEFKKGKHHGQGKETYSNGDYFEGEWKDGKTWNGTGYDKDGNIQYTLVNGKGFEQVEYKKEIKNSEPNVQGTTTHSKKVNQSYEVNRSNTISNLSYNNLTQCVLKNMMDRDLTGNNMFKMVYKQCDKRTVNVENKSTSFLTKLRVKKWIINECVLQTMKKNKLTGNKILKIVGGICERFLGVENIVLLGKKGIESLYFEYSYGVLNFNKTNFGVVGSREIIDKYDGKWKDGKPWNGTGTITYPFGIYVGKFKNGKEHGQGTTTYYDESKYEGEWKDGKTWNGTGYDKNRNITYKVLNGKEMKQ